MFPETAAESSEKQKLCHADEEDQWRALGRKAKISFLYVHFLDVYEAFKHRRWVRSWVVWLWSSTQMSGLKILVWCRVVANLRSSGAKLLIRIPELLVLCTLSVNLVKTLYFSSSQIYHLQSEILSWRC